MRQCFTNILQKSSRIDLEWVFDKVGGKKKAKILPVMIHLTITLPISPVETPTPLITVQP